MDLFGYQALKLFLQAVMLPHQQDALSHRYNQSNQPGNF